MNGMGSVEVSRAVAHASLHSGRTTFIGSDAPCACATTLDEVEAAWGLVYRRYTDMGLIDENPFGLHTVATAVGSGTSVIWGPEGPAVGYTLTLVQDSDKGLALDTVYARQMDALRRDGCRLLEVGMLADRRRSASRSIGALFSMMRWVAYDVLHHELTDIVIGVHPRHAQFYIRSYGFSEFAPETTYPLVRNHPVVGLRLRLREELAKDVLPRGLADVSDHPIPASAYAGRFRFEPGQLRGSRIEGYLASRCAASATPPAWRAAAGCGIVGAVQAG